MNERTRALFEAHVAHELTRLRGETPARALERAAENVLSFLGEVPLEEVLGQKQVLDIIERYVIDLRISGGITELAGQISQVVHGSEAGRRTRLDELLTDPAYEEFAAKIASLESAQREVLRIVAGTTTLRTIVTRLMTLTSMRLIGSLGGSRSDRIARLAKRLGPGIERRLARYYAQKAPALLRDGEADLATVLDSETMRSLADEIWSQLSGRALADVFATLDGADLEDFVVLGYECWLHFRKTSFFRQVSTQVVELVFEKYGGGSVRAFLDDMGVSERMLLDEIARLSGPALAHADASGLLERQVRARLQPFYDSAQVERLLAETGGREVS